MAQIRTARTSDSAEAQLQDPNQIIAAREIFSSTLYKKVVNDAKQDDKEMLFRHSFNLTEQELAEDYEPGQITIVLVGITLNKDLPAAKGKQLGVSGTKPPTEHILIFDLPERYTGSKILESGEELEDDHSEEMDEDTTALLVVTPCFNNPEDRPTKMYVLLKPENGIYSLYNVPEAEVFYFPEFRCSVKAGEQRQREWNTLVKRISIKNNVITQPKLTAYSAVQDTSVFTIDHAVAFAKNIIGPAAAYAMNQDANRDAWFLGQLMKRLGRTSIPQSSFSALLQARINAFKSLRDRSIARSKALRNEPGNDIVPESPARLWQLYGDTDDADAAQRINDSLCMFVTYHCAEAVDSITPQLQRIIETLETATGTNKTEDDGNSNGTGKDDKTKSGSGKGKGEDGKGRKDDDEP
ncbi:hypothetical protein COCMIDRAFT_5006 [Bipolaris oryzae ATCC 44560]|uniref:Uncharacterized protein n=1 Tax=Bipolaris oryzae ATCC 44560 TaxID=930090 RepID=W6ZEE0_COCMI|nr:uncharacterized protein COCMIDRAFT_5006 [Bipolaris oryzae ATCC 44560]EUC45874.1 hypothetical protein COCMIDRAFT_5006 [Bipolaris oryzae ATCC 44560]